MSTLSRAQNTLASVRDIVDQRVDDAEIPDWCAERGWSEFLIGLGDRELERCEAQGLPEVASSLRDMPESLRELALDVRDLCALPMLCARPLPLLEAEFRGVSSRKREQLTTLLGVLAPLVENARRIVDVGAGSGHFTRLSAQYFKRETLGLEQNPDHVARAISRARASSSEGQPAAAEFVICDAIREPLALRSDDLAIGLHACGELGDTLVRAVADGHAELALVSCCLQKISAPERASLSRAAGGFALRKETLGLSNLTSRAVGVEASMENTMRAREARYGLRLLLRGRGLEIPPGAEMRGINRRRAGGGLEELAKLALARLRRRAASQPEIQQCERDAAFQFGRMRRLSLPRNLLGRAIELSVVLDRAARLEESGHHVLVATLFEHAVTPRNIALFASRQAPRLPRVAR